MPFRRLLTGGDVPILRSCCSLPSVDVPILCSQGRCWGHGRGPGVADMMMVVVVQKVVHMVVWNPFFEGSWLSYEFCTEDLRRFLRARSFVVLAR